MRRNALSPARVLLVAVTLLMLGCVPSPTTSKPAADAQTDTGADTTLTADAETQVPPGDSIIDSSPLTDTITSSDAPTDSGLSPVGDADAAPPDSGPGDAVNNSDADAVDAADPQADSSAIDGVGDLSDSGSTEDQHDPQSDASSTDARDLSSDGTSLDANDGGGSGPDSNDVTPAPLGDENQGCKPLSTCNAGLTCENQICVSVANSSLGTIISLGSGATCAIRPEDKSLWCWGSNALSQLGQPGLRAAASPLLLDNSLQWRDISVGYHSCAVSVSGILKCWGRNQHYQIGVGNQTAETPVVVASNLSWRDVEVGMDQTCAITTDGALYCWGNGKVVGNPPSTDDVQTPTLVGDGSLSWKMVSVGGEHVCGIVNDATADGAGTLYCWGSNRDGQLGISSFAAGPFAFDSQKPVVERWRWVAAGKDYTCAVRADYSLFCWGSNKQDQFGTGTPHSTRTYPFPGPSGSWEWVAAGWSHVCAKERDNDKLRCWGDNRYGQLGNGSSSLTSLPTQVPGNWLRPGLTTNSFSASCAVTRDGAARCWGTNYNGYLGIGVKTWQEVPLLVSETQIFSAVSGPTDYRTCGLNGSNKLYCWGVIDQSFSKPLTPGDIRYTPTAIGNLDWSALSVGSGFSCGVANDSAYCWGRNTEGSLGLGPSAPDYLGTPTLVNVNNESVIAIASTYHSCAITASYRLFCWGPNYSGSLGLGDTDSRNTPTEVTTPTDAKWKRIAVGDHSCGILEPESGEAGPLYCWGSNYSGELGLATNSGDAVLVPTRVGNDLWLEIAVGASFSCGIRSDHALLCWGNFENGKLGLGTIFDNQTSPQLVNNTVSWRGLSLGLEHACAIQTSGTPGSLWCWGSNTAGVLGTGDFDSRNIPTQIAPGTVWFSVSAGTDGTCGVRSDGALYCWGDATFSQLGNDVHSLQFTPAPLDWPLP